jgi:tRNA threonylcarbamoyladenosine biosynthesis protein TsaE
VSAAAAPQLLRSGWVLVPTAEAMTDLGRAMSAGLRPGDLVVLSGDLGAGKTTLTRGIGEGLGVRGAVTSPTFVIARVHPAPPGRPPLVHVDAYRLGSLAELDDLDLDAGQEDSVTVVEWGLGMAEDLADARLELDLIRPKAQAAGRRGDLVSDASDDSDALDVGDEARTVAWRAFGGRWADTSVPGLETTPPARPA